MGVRATVRILVSTAALAAVFVALAAPVSAAPPVGGTGALVGSVARADGTPLPDACLITDSGASGTTDSGGSFRLEDVPSGEHLLFVSDCGAEPTQAPEWYGGPAGGADRPEDAQPLWVYPDADTPVMPITLRAGAFVTGTVTDDDGPLPAYCVLADDAASGATIAKAKSAPDGSYLLGPLRPGSFLVHFLDCRGLGDPYPDQWHPAATEIDDATPIDLTEGESRSDIDAQVETVPDSPDDPRDDPDGDPTSLSGTVTDEGGTPLQDICVMAVAGDDTLGVATTDSVGSYRLALDSALPVRVQFVDCSGSAAWAGEWFPDRSTEATAEPVAVTAGANTTGVDARLAPGAPGSISGRITNRHGQPIAGACVVAYLPYEFTVPAVADADGAFTIAGVPSGTFALGYLSCGDDGPLPWIDDPTTPGLRYAASFWPMATIDFDQDAIDPWASGARRVVVRPGEHLAGYDACFGCVDITIESVTTGVGTITIAFRSSTAAVLAAGVSAAAASAAPTITYTATCTSGTGGVTGSASATSSPITVGGLTPGAAYACTVSASDGTTTVGSADATVTVVAVDSSGDAVPTSPRGRSRGPARLAATGSPRPATLALAGAAACFAGLCLVAGTRRGQAR